MSVHDLPDVALIERFHPRPRDKQSAINWARSMMQRNDWVIIDTEATGIESGSEMIDLAVLSPDNEVLLDTLIRPVRARRMPKRASDVHGLTMEDLKDAPTFAEIAPKLAALVKDKIIVSYNTEYRIRLLRESFEQHGLRAPYFRSECAMIPYARYVGEWTQWKSDYKWYPLPGAVHRALGDCRATLAFIRKMANAADAVPSRQNTSESQADASSGGWVLIAVAAAVYIAIISAISGANHQSSSEPQEQPQPTQKPPIITTEESSPTTPITKVWNPIALPRDSKATFNTAFRKPDILDYQFFLAGQPEIIRSVYNARSTIVLSFLDSRNKALKKFQVNSANLVLNEDGFIMSKDSLHLSPDMYSRIKDWNVEVRFDKSALAPRMMAPPSSDIELPAGSESSDSAMPPLAPDFERPGLKNAGNAEQHSGVQTDRLAVMEQLVLGARQTNLPLRMRIDRLESEVFHTTFPWRSPADRTQHLQQTLMGGEH